MDRILNYGSVSYVSMNYKLTMWKQHLVIKIVTEERIVNLWKKGTIFNLNILRQVVEFKSDMKPALEDWPE